jgi:DNA transformation protein
MRNAQSHRELFAPFRPVAVKRMFGGAGIYADGHCFAIELDGEVYLKVDEASRAAFEAAGSRPAVYVAKGKPMEMSKWRLPAAAYDDKQKLKRWASLGLEAARRAAAARANRKRKARA